MTGSETRRAVRFEVFGVVQGVGYRYFVRLAARELGLDGWVRNRMDGSVEVVAAGEPAAVEELHRRLALGPPAARVERVDVSEATAPSSGFTVRLEPWY